MPGRADYERFLMLQSGTADLFDRSRIAEVDRHITGFYRWPDRIAQITLRDDVDLGVALGKIEDRLAHSAARSDQRNAHRRLHFAFSNASSVLRSRAWFASAISHSGKRTSADIAPRQP